jgi:hypothetical protein
MPRLDRGTASLAAGVALALLAIVLFANVMYVNANTDHARRHLPAEAHEDPQRVVVQGKVAAEPGDRVTIDWYPVDPLAGRFETVAFGPHDGRFETVAFHVVEEGEGRLVAAGEEPPNRYAREQRPATLEPGDPITLTRPPVADDVAPEQDLPGTYLDVVWVFEVAEDRSLPENGTARELFLEGLEMPGAGSFAVTSSSAVGAQPVFYAAEAGLALAALALGAAALRTRRATASGDREPEGTEAMVALVDQGERYLANLRNRLVVTGVLVAFAGVFGVVAVDEVLLLAIDPGAPAEGWRDWMTRGFAYVWVALAAAWLGMLVVVQRALHRWRENAADRPLDL